MRITILVSILSALYASNPGSPLPPNAPKARGSPHFLHGISSKLGPLRPYTHNPDLVHRDSIIRTFVVQHPNLSTRETFVAVQPLLAAAGARKIGYDVLRQQLAQIRHELNIVRKWLKLSPEQIAFLKEEFAWNHKQNVRTVWKTLHAVWGDGTPSQSTVASWWTAAKLDMIASKSMI